MIKSHTAMIDDIEETGESVYGFQITKSYYVVMLKNLWQATKGKGLEKEKNFIFNYAIIQPHEFLHNHIKDILLDLYDDEKIVDILSRGDELRLDTRSLGQVFEDDY